MSFQSRMQDRVAVYAKTAEADTWTRVGDSVLRCCITELSASGARRESRLLEPDVTHVCRMLPNSKIEAGQRFQRQSDKQEFSVRNLRNHRSPSPGQLIVGLAEVANAIT